YVTFSGKLAPLDQRRPLAWIVRGKNAGEARPSSFHYGFFAFSSGTSGSDIGVPFSNQRTLRVPGDLSGPGLWTSVDSVQVIFQIEDRDEELIEERSVPR